MTLWVTQQKQIYRLLVYENRQICHFVNWKGTFYITFLKTFLWQETQTKKNALITVSSRALCTDSFFADWGSLVRAVFLLTFIKIFSVFFFSSKVCKCYCRFTQNLVACASALPSTSVPSGKFWPPNLPASAMGTKKKLGQKGEEIYDP